MEADNPLLTGCQRRYAKRVEDTAVIKVYSNQKEVTLVVNGETMGTAAGEYVFTFENIPLKDGVNSITAISGNLTDTMEIEKVDTPEERYIFVDPRKGQAKDWVKRDERGNSAK